MAAELGDSEAMNRLGELFEEGQSVEKNTQVAEQFYHESQIRGNDEAKVNLALLMINEGRKENGENNPEAMLLEAAQKGN